MYCDAFGYCAGKSAKRGTIDPRSASPRLLALRSSSRSNTFATFRSSSPRSSRNGIHVHWSGKKARLAHSIQKEASSARLAMTVVVRLARKRKRTRVASMMLTNRNAVRSSSPWLDEHVKQLQRMVIGFDTYAATRHTLDTFDIVLWAVLCGAFKLARTLWLRKECESPLRLSLLVQSMCARIRLKEKKRVKELLETETFFRVNAIKLLDNIPDQETARKLLLSTASAKTALGAPKGLRLSLLDLAIDLRNVQFVAHRHCQVKAPGGIQARPTRVV